VATGEAKSGRPDWAAHGLLALLSLTWGSSFLLISISVESIPPLLGAAVRSTIAALILFALARAMRLPFPRPGRAIVPFAVLGLFSCALPFFLLGYAQQRIDSGLSAILVATTPLFTALLGGLRVKRRPNLFEVLGIVVGLVGVVVLVGPTALAGLGDDLAAQAAALAAGFCYAVGIVVASVAARHPPAVNGACTLTCAAILLWPASLVVDRPAEFEPTLAASLALGGLIVVGSVVASLLYYRVIDRAGATFVSFSTYLIPLVAVVLGALVLGEAITPSAVAAMALILGGVALAGRGSVRPLSRATGTGAKVVPPGGTS
jgi:drug/metabolite transporter (DMT)-like permease